MSHWTKIKTKVSDQDILVAALTRMGFNPQVGQHNISQYGTTEKAEVKLDNAVGFSKQKDGTFAMVGDFYHSKIESLHRFYGRNAEFSSKLQTNYAIEEAKVKLEDQGFYCTENEEAEVGQDGMITMTFESWM